MKEITSDIHRFRVNFQKVTYLADRSTGEYLDAKVSS